MPFMSKYSDIRIPDKSVVQVLLDRLTYHSHRLCMIDCSRKVLPSVSYEEVRDGIKRCAAFLRNRGVKKGDVIAICCNGCVEYMVIMFGIIAVGATASVSNPTFSTCEMIPQFKVTKPKAVFVDEMSLGTVEKIREELPCVKDIFVVGESELCIAMKKILFTGPVPDHDDDVTLSSPDDVAVLPSSSGTTGLPKKVVLTHKALLATCLIYEEIMTIDENCFIYLDRPMYHMSGWGFTLFSLLAGARVIIDRVSPVTRMFQAIENFKITHTLATPPMMIEMANMENFKEFDTSSLKQLQCGGATVPEALIQTLNSRYNVEVVPLYGMTEFSPVSINKAASKFPSSVGMITPNTLVKIIDLTSGAELKTDETGEILVKGPQMMKGYLENPDATKSTIDKDGWLHTGDIGRVDEQGYLYVTGRLKEAIKYKTFQVAPAELESFLLRHPKIADVGVVGVSDLSLGELPRAFIVKQDETLTEDEIHKNLEDFSRSRLEIQNEFSTTFVVFRLNIADILTDELAEYKQLRGGIQFVRSVPKSPFGKIQRDLLRKGQIEHI